MLWPRCARGITKNELYWVWSLWFVFLFLKKKTLFSGPYSGFFRLGEVQKYLKTHQKICLYSFLLRFYESGKNLKKGSNPLTPSPGYGLGFRNPQQYPLDVCRRTSWPPAFFNCRIFRHFIQIIKNILFNYPLSPLPERNSCVPFVDDFLFWSNFSVSLAFLIYLCFTSELTSF